MARRKKTSKKRVTRRRSKRMGAVNMAGGLTSALFTIAGGVAARFVSNTINGTNLDASYKGYVAAAAPIAVGLFLPKFLKNDMGKALGTGMIAVGGLELVQSTGVLKGIDGMEMPMIAGYQNYMALAPTNQNTRGVIAGMDTRTAAILAG
jgi:hypothetical protein